MEIAESKLEYQLLELQLGIVYDTKLFAGDSPTWSTKP